MKQLHDPAGAGFAIVFAWASLLAVPAFAAPRGQVSLYGLRQTPSGQDATRYSRGGWGGGLRGLLTVPATKHVLALAGGFEVANLLSETVEFRDPKTQLRVEQQTSQHHARFFLGPEIGGHSDGFFRPHLGVNLALNLYDFGVDVVVPDDVNRENEIRQHLRGDTDAAFGYDFALGADLNFGKWYVEGGAKFTKTFNLPQTLGEGSVSISPGYAVAHLGVGLNFPLEPR